MIFLNTFVDEYAPVRAYGATAVNDDTLMISPFSL